MSFDRSLARCSFCGKRPPEVGRMVAGPGAAYICETCLQLCNEILNDPTSFSSKALELASRPPVVIAPPQNFGRQSTQKQYQGSPNLITKIGWKKKHQHMPIFLHRCIRTKSNF